MLMVGSLEASYVVLSHTLRIGRVLWLAASVNGCRVIEAGGVEPLRGERPRGKDRLATLTRLPLCSGRYRKSLCDCRNGQTSHQDDEDGDDDNETPHNLTPF